MFKHIVVPLDGSKLSEASLAYVSPLAGRLDAKVVLLHAYIDPYADMFGSGAEGRSEDVWSSVPDYLKGVAERLQAEGVKCETHVESGTPAAVILRYIEERKPDLIAMSTHGRSGLRRMMVGSVTTTILPRAETPLLTIHPDEDEIVSEISIEKIVVPLDMSERSEDVLSFAAALAKTLSIDLTLMTCVPSAAQLYVGAVPEVYPYPEDIVERAQKEASEYLQSTANAISEECGIDVQWDILEGAPANRIVEYAETQPNSLIAMCTQGRTGLGRWVLGSVTDAVIRTGHTPALVVPHSAEE